MTANGVLVWLDDLEMFLPLAVELELEAAGQDVAGAKVTSQEQ